MFILVILSLSLNILRPFCNMAYFFWFQHCKD